MGHLLLTLIPINYPNSLITILYINASTLLSSLSNSLWFSLLRDYTLQHGCNLQANLLRVSAFCWVDHTLFRILSFLCFLLKTYTLFFNVSSSFTLFHSFLLCFSMFLLPLTVIFSSLFLLFLFKTHDLFSIVSSSFTKLIISCFTVFFSVQNSCSVFHCFFFLFS